MVDGYRKYRDVYIQSDAEKENRYPVVALKFYISLGIEILQ